MSCSCLFAVPTSGNNLLETSTATRREAIRSDLELQIDVTNMTVAAAGKRPEGCRSTWPIVLLACVLPLAHSQPVQIIGRDQPIHGDPNQLPLILSWPASQITVTWQGSSTITAVISNVSFTSPYIFENLAEYTDFSSSGFSQPSATFQSGLAFLTLSGLPLGPQSATLTKIVESSSGPDCWYDLVVFKDSFGQAWNSPRFHASR